MNDKLPVIVSKPRDHDPDQERLAQDVIAVLSALPGLEIAVVPHLYDLATDGATMRHLRALPGDMVVLSWLYPRAAFWVLDANGVKGRMGPTSFFPKEELDADAGEAERPEDASGRTIWCIDLRTTDALAPYVAELEQILVATGRMTEADAVARAIEPAGAVSQQIGESGPTRWYPVVDRSRCTNCMECMNFCLFGVFGLDPTEHVQVEEPDACRDGCPACSRICPSGAIMFPQHADPVIAGDGMTAGGDGFKLDLSQLFGGVSAEDLASQEQRRAVAEAALKPGEKKGKEKEKPVGKPTDLDQLVDGLDEMEL